MKNIFINLADGEGVMVFTENEKITPEVVEHGFKYKGFDILETYEVSTDDLQYYVFDPLWLTPEKEEVLLEFARKYREEEEEREPWKVTGIVWDTDEEIFGGSDNLSAIADFINACLEQEAE